MRALLMIVLTALLTGCGKPGCIPTAEAEGYMRQGSRHEAAGRIYDAWEAYKSASIGPACDSRSRQREVAGEHGSRLMDEINQAYDATEKAISHFRQANGRWPSSLAEIAGDIPKSARRAFAGFTYTPRADRWGYRLERRAG